MSINKQIEGENKPEEENKPALTESSEEAKEETKKPKEQFYTVKELGKLIFRNTNTIRQHIHKGDIKAVKMGGRGWRISPAEVERVKKEGYPTPGLHQTKTAKPGGYTKFISQKEREEPVKTVKAEKPKETEKEAKPWYSIGGLDW